jgi:hypothetical protein
MSGNLVAVTSLIIAAAVCGLAMWKGNQPTRLGALAVICTWAAAASAQLAFGARAPTIPVLIADGVLATVFLVLAIRYASPWLGGAMLLQSASFAVHAERLTYAALDTVSYVRAINALSYAVLLVLFAATLATWRRRPKASPAAAPPPVLA